MNLTLIFKKKAIYLLLMLTASFFGFFKLIVYSKLISVEDFGTYSLVLSTYIFLVFLGGMGLSEGLLKKGSMCFATEDIKSIKDYFLRALIFSVVITGSVSFLLIILSRIFLIRDGETLLIFCLTVVLAFATILFNLIDSFIRSQQKFLLFASILAIKNIIAITLGSMWATTFGVRGLIFSELVSVLIVFLLSFAISIKLSDIKLYNSKSAAILISNGYQMMLTLVLRNIALMLDRWIIAAAVGVVALGYYSFSMILLTICMVLVGFLITIKGPEWISNFKIDNDIKKLIRNVNSLIWKSLLALSVFGVIFFFKIEEILNLFYPKYAENTVVNIMFIVYLSLFAIVPIYLYDWIFIATSREGLLIKINIFASISSFFLYSIVWLAGLGILAFSFAFFLSKIILLIGYSINIRKIYVFQSA